MELSTDRIVVIGAGQAGATLVARLRTLGHTGPLTIVGAEPYPPYQRPPLSKAYLKGEITRDRLFLRPRSFYDTQGIELVTGTRALSIDRSAKTVHLADGRTLAYDRLALTTGATPRHLGRHQGADLAGVLTMRGLACADALSAVMEPGGRAVVVGGGYIGLEAAAVLREKGLAVTVIEQAGRILSRVAAPATADYIRALHRRHGVAVREAAGLVALTGKGGGVTGAELSDGRHIAADFALVGIGVDPDHELASGAGLATNNGIVVDAAGRTSDPSIFAAGDCAAFPYRGRTIRLESVPHAIDQAEAVAETMLGADTIYVAKPWFWSDQYDVKLQIAGLNAGYERTVTRPGPRPGTQSVWYWRGSELLAVDAMNDPRAYMTAKRWIEEGVSPDPDRIGCVDAELKTLA